MAKPLNNKQPLLGVVSRDHNVSREVEIEEEEVTPTSRGEEDPGIRTTEDHQQMVAEKTETRKEVRGEKAGVSVVVEAVTADGTTSATPTKMMMDL